MFQGSDPENRPLPSCQPHALPAPLPWTVGSVKRAQRERLPKTGPQPIEVADSGGSQRFSGTLNSSSRREVRWWGGGGRGGGGGCGWNSKPCAPAALRRLTLFRTVGGQPPNPPTCGPTHAPSKQLSNSFLPGPSVPSNSFLHWLSAKGQLSFHTPGFPGKFALELYFSI